MRSQLETSELTVHEHSLAHVKFTARWHDTSGEHTAIQHVEKFNVWRDMDLLPRELVNDILHQPVGQGEPHTFARGELLPGWQQTSCVTVSRQNFRGRLPGGQPVEPRTGRYYPAGWFGGVNGVFSENMYPARVVEIKGDDIVVDFNHPLSSQNIELDVEIIDILPPVSEHGGRCSDMIETLLNHGPGMQMPLAARETEFLVDTAFDRVDDNNDTDFYQRERLVHHLDANARQIINELYADKLQQGWRVLDLMSSWESHTPAELELSLSGLGMNEAELKANPQLSDYTLHDLNEDTALPYADESFDAVICTASVEYLTHPLQVFAEVKRILRPGGRFIVSFSNRWFPTKVIALWPEMHEFERIGLVMTYFRKSGWQGAVNSFSCRGLQRPEGDPHFAQTQVSDPVYAVWGEK